MKAARQAPLSFAQERFWFMERLIEGIPLYHYPFAYRVRGALDERALRKAIGRVVQRHEILRTRFPARPPSAVQEILDGWVPALETAEIGPGPEAEDATRAWMSDLTARPFDLAAEPGFRVGLARRGADDHVLLFVHHHIAFDGWSRRVLATEIGRLYAALRRGEEPDLPPLPIQYSDYAAWQRKEMGGERGQSGRMFWAAELTGAPTDLDVPADRPRPARPNYRGSRLRRVLPQEAREAIEDIARGEKATPFMALLAVFEALMGRYADLDDFLVGVPVAGRTEPSGVGDLVGPFVNTMVLRADLSGDPDYRTLVRRARTNALRTYPHQEFPFEALVETIGPERSLSRNPLFQVMLNYRSYQGRAFDLEGLSCDEIPFSAGMSDVDLTLSALAWRAGPLALEWDCPADRFEKASIERMADHFERLVRGVAVEPDRPVSEIPILSDEERRSVLGWGRSNEPLVEDSVVSRILEAARRDPDAAAIVSGDLRLPYGEFTRMAGGVAAALGARGKGPGSFVGVCLDRSPELFVSIVGTLASGAAYLPLDPSLPDERLRYIIEDSGVDVVLTDERQSPRVEALGAVAVRWDEHDGGEERPIEDPATGEDPAYLIYTSGSAGRPKGVEIERRSVANFVHWAGEALGIEPGDRVLQFCSIGFDVSVMESLPTLARGATLVLRDPGPPPSASGFGAWMGERGITVAILPTGYWHVWATEVGRAGTPSLPSSLRLVVVAGEKALAGPYAGWRRVAPASVRWINGYGPTEATVIASIFEPDPSRQWDPEEDIPILGGAVAGSRVYVLDRRTRPLPANVPGEVWLGGPGITRGYHGSPERTAERIVEDPFEPGGRLYRTGDRARWSPDGQLEFLGRMDDQLKIRGYRIEPAEIEARLAEHPDVAAGAVVAHQIGRHPVLVAYASPAGRPLEPTAVKAWLAERLPDYMVPGIVVMLEEMPLTASGKVDRSALPAPTSLPADEGYVAPRTPSERALAGIWQRLLGVDRIGIRDNFFDLGGHSLVALEVVAEAELVLDRPVPLSLVFEWPTIDDLAAAIEAEPVS